MNSSHNSKSELMVEVAALHRRISGLETAEAACRQQVEALRQSEELHRVTMENLTDPIFVTDDKGRFTFICVNVSSILGYSPAEVEAMGNISELLGDNLYDPAELAAQGEIRDIERVTPCKDGRELTFLIHVKRVSLINGGTVLYLCLDITRRKQVERQLEAALAEKETLINELYHRANNNMQVICSMLESQAARLPDERLRQVFEEIENKILAMSLVHQKLYQSQNLSRINLQGYITELAQSLVRGNRYTAGRVSLHLDLAPVWTLIDTAIPCGLILNELVSNALKHAFPGDRPGQISVGLRRLEGGEIQLEVADDGVGFPPNFDPRQDGRLGLRDILGIGELQLQGQVRIKQDRGVAFDVRFKDNRYKARV